MIYLKTQKVHSLIQIASIETLQRCPICIECKTDTKLDFADALSRLYIFCSFSTNGINSDWLILIIGYRYKGFYVDTTKVTKTMVLKHNGYSSIYLIRCIADFPQIDRRLSRRLAKGRHHPIILLRSWSHLSLKSL